MTRWFDFLPGDLILHTLQLSIVHRLPECYRWLTGSAGTRVEPIPQHSPCNDNTLIGLKLLGVDGENAWHVMRKFSQTLSAISVECSVVECNGEPCLFVKREDEPAATGRLKNDGVAIAETFSCHNPF